jgi:DNA invertase Pin-like site-specific DNA recombinase
MAPQRPKFVAYYRVSTQAQGRSGLGLEAQRASVEQHLAATSGLLVDQFKEVESGKRADRPELAAAILRCRQSRATLLVAKLDRLSRNVAFLMTLRDSGVRFLAIDLPEANTLTLTVMAGMAQHEREVISSRTRAALAARKARGLQLGTPRDLSAYQAAAAAAGTQALQAAARERAELVRPVIEAARRAGHVSLTSIAVYLNDQGVTTPRGKAWTTTAVRNALRQLEG